VKGGPTSREKEPLWGGSQREKDLNIGHRITRRRKRSRNGERYIGDAGYPHERKKKLERKLTRKWVGKGGRKKFKETED